MKKQLLPDLLAFPPEDLQIERMVATDGLMRVFLRLSQSFGNAGRGRVQIRRGNPTPSCPGKRRAKGYQDIYYSDGSKKSIPLKECMIYHTIHKHWHVANIAKYDLCEVDPDTGGPGNILAFSDKVSFCLNDEFRLKPEQYRGRKYSKRYRSCHTRVFGISPGWAEEYDYKVYGQSLDITGIPDGVYVVRTTINPKKLIKESTRRNNIATKI